MMFNYRLFIRLYKFDIFYEKKKFWFFKNYFIYNKRLMYDIFFLNE